MWKAPFYIMSTLFGYYKCIVLLKVLLYYYLSKILKTVPLFLTRCYYTVLLLLLLKDQRTWIFFPPLVACNTPFLSQPTLPVGVHFELSNKTFRNLVCDRTVSPVAVFCRRMFSLWQLLIWVLWRSYESVMTIPSLILLGTWIVLR